MKHTALDNIKIYDTDISFEQIYNKEYIPKDYIGEIKKANLLILPNESFRDEGDILFPETTRDFFEYIKENTEDNIVADIAISDENFQLIELHSAVIEVATIIVQILVLPVATSMIASFLYELVKKHHRKPEDTSAKVQIIAEETATKKSKIILYEGPVSGIKDALDQATKDLFSKE
ncbi:MAG: hypothetical protein K2H01_07370 [Ruminococcus sp.]|nr:hypothetical protein [Ruminococcus sp.]